ncbi:hypothetical protein HDU96_008355 [Phlyctochytrium bullatum]|nr:hypothetical protein HDU96_008355 [Phlyctochytrium bullatum]
MDHRRNPLAIGLVTALATEAVAHHGSCLTGFTRSSTGEESGLKFVPSADFDKTTTSNGGDWAKGCEAVCTGSTHFAGIIALRPEIPRPNDGSNLRKRDPQLPLGPMAFSRFAKIQNRFSCKTRTYSGSPTDEKRSAGGAYPARSAKGCCVECQSEPSSEHEPKPKPKPSSKPNFEQEPEPEPDSKSQSRALVTETEEEEDELYDFEYDEEEEDLLDEEEFARRRRRSLGNREVQGLQARHHNSIRNSLDCVPCQPFGFCGIMDEKEIYAVYMIEHPAAALVSIKNKNEAAYPTTTAGGASASGSLVNYWDPQHEQDAEAAPIDLRKHMGVIFGIAIASSLILGALILLAYCAIKQRRSNSTSRLPRAAATGRYYKLGAEKQSGPQDRSWLSFLPWYRNKAEPQPMESVASGTETSFYVLRKNDNGTIDRISAKTAGLPRPASPVGPAASSMNEKYESSAPEPVAKSPVAARAPALFSDDIAAPASTLQRRDSDALGLAAPRRHSNARIPSAAWVETNGQLWPSFANDAPAERKENLG